MRGGGSWSRAAAAVFATLIAASCTLAREEPPERVGPVADDGVATLTGAGEPAGAPLLPGRIPAVEEVGVEGLDAILHTPAALDPWLQDRTAFWIGFWTSREADYFGRYLERMSRYHPVVDRELEARDLPYSLRYLPIVESGYRPGAVSRVGATGMWQIMTPTARGLGLTVTSIVDDRRDPVASTVAALDYLEELHERFESWFLVLAAYNAGPGRISGLLRRHAPDASVPADRRFFAIVPHLPAETRDFVPRFLAAATLARRPDSHGFDTEGTRDPIAFDEVRVPDATSFDVIAEAAEVAEEEIVEMNPQFLRGFTPNGEARTVRVPAGTGDRFERNYAQIPESERLTFLEHQVASGETFTHIARRYGVSVSELQSANSRIDPRRLQVGARVVVPVAGGGERVAMAGAGSGGGGGGQHVVAPGESLWTIARQHGVTVSGLASANGLSPDGVLQPGEELVIP